ncbi:acyl carrier protein [bacterium]|nr:acyl carrier protein [bacterium]
MELIEIAAQLVGTVISVDVPLMSAGLDSIGVTELSTRFGERLGTELPSTLIFDHPSLGSIASSTIARQGRPPEEPPCSSQEQISMPTVRREIQPRNLDSVAETISAIICDAQGTLVAADAPLMAFGLDSIAATEFASTLTE